VATSSGDLRRFACPPAAVLDCANGPQKENPEEVNKVEQDCEREGGADNQAGAQREGSQEISEEDDRSEQS
jgi:hypothetical protein